MHPAISSTVEAIRRGAGAVVATLLGLMFAAFIVQIVFRYFFNLPTGWTSEFSVAAWLYIVLVGSALWLRDSEAIRFDLVATSLGPRARRVIGVLVAIATVVLFGMAFPASYDYVAFMKVESSSYLKVRLDVLYSVYLLFAAAVIVRYAWAAWRLLRGGEPEAADVTKTGSGL